MPGIDHGNYLNELEFMMLPNDSNIGEEPADVDQVRVARNLTLIFQSKMIELF